MNCSYRLARLKKTATIRWTTISAQILPREKQARHPSTCLSKLMSAQRCSHRLIEHRTMEPLNEKFQIAQEYGLLPADARQQLEK